MEDENLLENQKTETTDQNTPDIVEDNPMGSKPMLPLITSMALPTIFSMIIQALYNIVDGIFVAKVSQQAFAAVSLVFPVQMIIISVCVGTGIGINSLISRQLGAGKQKAAGSTAAHGLILGLCNWIFFAVLGIFFAKPFFAIFSDDPTLSSMATTYGQIVLLASFGVSMSIICEKVLQATGDMLHPMKMMLTGAITNIILDPILIFGYLGAPEMGVQGAAVATVIGQTAAGLYALFVIFIKKGHRISISFKNFTFNKTTIKEIYRVGFPSIIMQSIGSFTTTGLNLILIQFSEIAVSVLGVYFKLQSFIFMPVFGLGSGLMPIMGYSFGAKNKARLVESIKLGSIMALAIMTIGVILFQLMPAQLMGIFDAQDEMLTIGITALRSISWGFFAAAMSITFSNLFQAIGCGSYSMHLSVLRNIGLILPIAIFLAQFGLDYVWWCFAIAEGLSLFFALFLYNVSYKKLIKYL